MQNLPCCCLLDHRDSENKITANAFRETDIRPANSVHYQTKIWSQPVVTYAYLNPDAEKEEVVEQWVEYLNSTLGIRLKKIENTESADMRFDFDPADGGRSYYGNDALKISDKKHWTTNFGFLEYHPLLKSQFPVEQWWKIERIVPHELCGHALGAMLHMQMHPDIVYSDYDRTWREEQGYKTEEINAHYSLKQQIENGSRTDIQFVFRADSESGMLYPIHEDRLEVGSKKYGYTDSDYPIINYGWSTGDQRVLTYQHPKESNSCISDFEKAQIEKTLVTLNNQIKALK